MKGKKKEHKTKQNLEWEKEAGIGEIKVILSDCYTQLGTYLKTKSKW